MRKNFKCKHCAKCCLTIPCVFAQVKHPEVRIKGEICPELEKQGEIYHCKLIERDPEAASVLISGDCDDPAKVHLKKTWNPKKIIKEYFPEATDEFIEFVMWEKTGYPEFWNIPEDGWTSEQCFRKQVKELKENYKPCEESKITSQSRTSSDFMAMP